MMEFNRFQYGMPTKIVFGIDTFNEVGEHQPLGTKALITGRSEEARVHRPADRC